MKKISFGTPEWNNELTTAVNKEHLEDIVCINDREVK